MQDKGFTRTTPQFLPCSYSHCCSYRQSSVQALIFIPELLQKLPTWARTFPSFPVLPKLEHHIHLSKITQDTYQIFYQNVLNDTYLLYKTQNLSLPFKVFFASFVLVIFPEYFHYNTSPVLYSKGCEFTVSKNTLHISALHSFLHPLSLNYF